MPSHLHPLCTPRASPFVVQRLLWCIRGSKSPWGEIVRRHCSCLLTKRGSRQHAHHPKRTKISYILSVQHADLGCSKWPFSRAFRMYPTYPSPTGHTVGTNKPIMTTTSEKPPSWHKRNNAERCLSKKRQSSDSDEDANPPRRVQYAINGNFFFLVQTLASRQGPHTGWYSREFSESGISAVQSYDSAVCNQ